MADPEIVSEDNKGLESDNSRYLVRNILMTYIRKVKYPSNFYTQVEVKVFVTKSYSS